MSQPKVINTSEFDAHDRRQRRARARYGFVQEGDKDEQRQQVLCGLGTQYCAPHIHAGKIQMLARGCFTASIESGRVVNLQMDHEGNMVIADTRTGLELEDTDLGLLFRLPMHRARNAAIVARVVDVGNRACASVCYQVEDERTETIGGHPVRVIAKADLREISLVKRGAVEQAFAFLSDSVNNPTVRGMDRSTIFALDRLTHNVKRATRAQVENSADLVDRVNRLSARYGLPPL
jgi:HK97 family phage prohead protease